MLSHFISVIIICALENLLDYFNLIENFYPPPPPKKPPNLKECELKEDLSRQPRPYLNKHIPEFAELVTLYERDQTRNKKSTFCSHFYLLIHKLYEDKIMYLSSINDIKYKNLVFTYSTRKMLMVLKLFTTICN